MEFKSKAFTHQVGACVGELDAERILLLGRLDARVRVAARKHRSRKRAAGAATRLL